MFLRDENLTYLLLVLLYVVGTPSLHAEIEDSNSVVVSVNDVNILYKDIKVDLKEVQMLHPEYSKLQIENEVQKQETRRLIGKIREVIFKQKITEFGLTVSEQEVDARVEEIFKKTGMTSEKAKAICESGKAVYEALVAWQMNPSDGNAIYDEKLSDTLISKEQWKLWQRCCDTPEKLKDLVVPKNIEDMKKNSRESSRRDVLYQKLEEVITKDISVSKKEIEEEYRKKHGAEEIEQMGLIEKELLTRKKDMAIRTWWQEQYNKSNIVILDKRFDEALELLNNR
ncbi:MAG: hypothetical protein PHY02_02750 [Phycisphaerae bacterium]|nr:hypothetical protein [Phycisphaerae bacterium]